MPCHVPVPSGAVAEANVLPQVLTTMGGSSSGGITGCSEGFRESGAGRPHGMRGLARRTAVASGEILAVHAPVIGITSPACRSGSSTAGKCRVSDLGIHEISYAAR